MGALSGRLSPLAFKVQGSVESWDKVLEQLTRLRFQEISPESGKQQSFGWVNLTDPFATRFEKPAIFFGESVVGLSMRMDSITIPGSQVKLRLVQRVRALLEESGRENITKAELASMKDDLVAELSRKTFPTIKVYEMLYHTGTGRLWFFGKSKSVVQTFFDLFYETFSLGMVPDSPYTVASKLLGEERADDLLDLEQTVFSSALDR